MTGRTSNAKVKLMTLQQDAVRLVGQAEFRSFWPIEVRKTLVRAALTEGEIPPYAERRVRNALRDARRIESKMTKDIDVGERTLSQSQRRALAK